jgi:hypothetical protein
VGPQMQNHPALIRTLHHSVLRRLFETSRHQGKKPHQSFLDLFPKTACPSQTAPPSLRNPAPGHRAGERAKLLPSQGHNGCPPPISGPLFSAGDPPTLEASFRTLRWMR